MIPDSVLRRVLRSDALVALTGDLVRALLALLILAAVVVITAYYVALARYMFVDLHMNDFGKFYYSARAFLDGQDMYGPTPATEIPVSTTMTQQFWNMNPPHFHLIVLPLALLSPLPALLVWTVVNVTGFFTSLRLVTHELRIVWTRTRIVWAVVAFILCSITGTIIVTGQMTFLLMLLLTLAWVDQRRGRWDRAAIGLGIAASIKPFLALFWIDLVLGRQFRAAAIMAGSAFACVLAGLAIFGWPAYFSWMSAVSGVSWAWAPMNGSILGILARSLTTSPLFIPALDAPGVITPIFIALAVAVTGTSFAMTTQDRTPASVDRTFAILFLLSQLISPLGWIYYLWLIAGPLAALAIDQISRPSRLRTFCLAAAIPGLLMPVPMTVWWADRMWNAPTIASIAGWTMVALWGAVVVDGRIRRDSPAAP